MAERISTAHLIRRILWLVVGILGQGCSSPHLPGPGPESGAAAQAAGLPPGAVEVGEDLYQVPIGEDEAGCTMYRLYSPSMLVAQVISYRDARGGFTTDRRKADCITAGSD